MLNILTINASNSNHSQILFINIEINVTDNILKGIITVNSWQAIALAQILNHDDYNLLQALCILDYN